MLNLFDMFEFINIAHAGVITDAPTLPQIGMKILNFLLSVAGIIAIIMAVVNGVRYMVAFGNEDQLKDVKKSFVYWLIGAVILFSLMILIKTIGGIFAN